MARFGAFMSKCFITCKRHHLSSVKMRLDELIVSNERTKL